MISKLDIPELDISANVDCVGSRMPLLNMINLLIVSSAIVLIGSDIYNFWVIVVARTGKNMISALITVASLGGEELGTKLSSVKSLLAMMTAMSLSVSVNIINVSVQYLYGLVDISVMYRYFSVGYGDFCGPADFAILVIGMLLGLFVMFPVLNALYASLFAATLLSQQPAATNVPENERSYKRNRLLDIITYPLDVTRYLAQIGRAAAFSLIRVIDKNFDGSTIDGGEVSLIKVEALSISSTTSTGSYVTVLQKSFFWYEKYGIESVWFVYLNYLLFLFIGPFVMLSWTIAHGAYHFFYILGRGQQFILSFVRLVLGRLDDLVAHQLQLSLKEKELFGDATLDAEAFGEFVGSLVIERVFLLFMVPYLSVVATLFIEIAPCPIFVYSPWLKSRLPKFFHGFDRQEAVTSLADRMKLDEAEVEAGFAWVVYLLMASNAVQHSRIMQWVLGVQLWLFAMLIAFVPSSHVSFYVTLNTIVLLFLLMQLCSNLDLAVNLGLFWGITDAHFLSMLCWISDYDVDKRLIRIHKDDDTCQQETKVSEKDGSVFSQDQDLVLTEGGECGGIELGGIGVCTEDSSDNKTQPGYVIESQLSQKSSGGDSIKSLDINIADGSKICAFNYVASREPRLPPSLYKFCLLVQFGIVGAVLISTLSGRLAPISVNVFPWIYVDRGGAFEPLMLSLSGIKDDSGVTVTDNFTPWTTCTYDDDLANSVNDLCDRCDFNPAFGAIVTVLVFGCISIAILVKLFRHPRYEDALWYWVIVVGAWFAGIILLASALVSFEVGCSDYLLTLDIVDGASAKIHYGISAKCAIVAITLCVLNIMWVLISSVFNCPKQVPVSAKNVTPQGDGPNSFLAFVFG